MSEDYAQPLHRGIGGSMQCSLGLANVEAAKAAFNKCAARGDDFLVQAMIVPAQYNDAAMSDDYGVG